MAKKHFVCLCVSEIISTLISKTYYALINVQLISLVVLLMSDHLGLKDQIYGEKVKIHSRHNYLYKMKLSPWNK